MGALTLVLLCGWVLAYLFAGVPVPHAEDLALVTDTARLLFGVLGAVLLFLQFRATQASACLALASGFLLMTLLTAAQLLRELQGAFIDLRLLLFTDLALPVAMIAYGWSRKAADGGAVRHREAMLPAAAIAVTVALAALITWTTAASTEPGVGVPVAQASPAWRALATALLGGTLVAAMALLWPRRRTWLDLAILLTLGVWLMDVMLRAAAPDDAIATWHFGRFYRVLGLACVVFALLAENVARSSHRRQGAEGVIDGLAEELNQPLCAITANADAITRLIEREPADLVEIRAALADIVQDATRASDTLRQAQRLVATQEPPADIDVAQLVGECVEHLRNELLARRVTCEVETAPQLPGIRGVRRQLLQLLVNLLTNSLEALSGVHHRERWLRVRADRHGDAVGLRPQAQLRLAWCRKIVAAHGGQLSAAPGEAGGAAFKLLLPANS